jgi:hypothetical protein
VFAGILFVVFMMTVIETWSLLKPVADALTVHFGLNGL